MSMSIPSASTRLQLISSSRGLNKRWTCTESCLALAVVYGLFPELRQVLAANGIGYLNVAQFAQRAVSNDQLDMHFSFALKPGNALAEGAAVGPNRVLQGFITVKDGSKTERQHRTLTETDADHARVLKNLFFVKAGGRAVKLTDDDRKFSARISEHCGPTYSLNAIQDERTPCTCSIG
jgi:hypothetical protein